MTAPMLERAPWWPAEHSDACIEGHTFDGQSRCYCGEWLERVRAIRTHPAYPELFERYKAARKAWAYLGRRLLVPMEVRHYCDAYVNQGGAITWTGNHVWPWSTATMPLGIVIDQAWDDSGMVA